MKKIIGGCLALLLSTMVYATDDLSAERTFIGIEYGQGDIYNGTTKLLGNINDSNNDTDKYGIRFGAENDEWRAMFVYTYEENDKETEDVRQFLISVDYFIAKEAYNAVVFKPYVGVNIGYMNFQASTEATGIKAIEESGLLYGGEAGLAIGLAEMIDLDFMFRYSFSTIDEVDHTQDLNIALHYYF
jgi:opacity protein-like surface antigen